MRIRLACVGTFGPSSALYALFYIYVVSHVIELVVTGLSKRKAVFIISRQWASISEQILHKLGRGLTVLNGEGGQRQSRAGVIHGRQHAGTEPVETHCPPIG